MRLISLDEIVIPPDRARKEFDPDALRELKTSILSQGLFHPLLLQGDERTLIAGERRLRVLREIHRDNDQLVVFDGTQIPSGQAPFVVHGSSDEISVLQSELDENKKRANLTWSEEADFISRIHAHLRKQEAFKTQEDVRVHLKVKSETLTKALAIAPFLSDPEIRSAPTLQEGLKILEKKLESAHRQAVAKKLGGTVQRSGHTLILGDLCEVLPTLPAAHFDCIIADPPYGVNAQNWNNMSAAPHTYLDTPEYATKLYAMIATEGFRITKDLAHIYLFCDSKPALVHEAMQILTAAGWRVWPWPLIYSRGSTNGICPWPENGPRRTFESIIFAIKGNKRVLKIAPDLIECSTRSDDERGAHKPAELYADLLSRSCLPGDRVLEPCFGTGSIFDALDETKVQVTGIEIDAEQYARAQERIK